MGNLAKWSVIIYLLGGYLLTACTTMQVETSIPPSATESSPPIPTQTSEPSKTAAQTQPTEPADIIFHNGVIITIEKAMPVAEAVAILGNLIQAVGTQEEIMAYKGSKTVVIDLQGNTLMPGFEEGHIHYLRNKTAQGEPIGPLMDNLLSRGWTSVTEMHSIDEFIDLFLEAEKNGQVKLRVNIFGGYNCGFLVEGKSALCPSWYLDHPPILDPNHMVRVPGVKIFLDGAGGDRGCPYNSFKYPDNIEEYWPGIWNDCTYPYGDLYLTEEQLIPVLQDIQDRGYRAAFHIMGDAAIDVALNSIEAVLNGKSNLEVRYQIEHNSALRPDQVQRYKDMNIIAMIPGYINSCEADVLKAMYSEDYYTWYMNRFSLPGLGVHTFSSSDYPGKKDINSFGLAINPAFQLYGLVTRRQFLDEKTICTPPEWMIKDKISIEKALEMLTIEPAFAVSMEDYIGSIKPGKFADLVILSDDPLIMDPKDLYKLTVWMTMVNGETMFCTAGKEEFCPSQETVLTPITTETTESALNTTQVKYNCDDRPGSPIQVSHQNFIVSNMGWAVLAEDQIQDYKDSLLFTIFVDGLEIQSTVHHSATEKKNDQYAVQSLFDVGVLEPGQHQIRILVTFSKKISDGYNWIGPGTQYPTIDKTCTVIVDQ